MPALGHLEALELTTKKQRRSFIVRGPANINHEKGHTADKRNRQRVSLSCSSIAQGVAGEESSCRDRLSQTVGESPKGSGDRVSIASIVSHLNHISNSKSLSDEAWSMCAACDGSAGDLVETRCAY